MSCTRAKSQHLKRVELEQFVRRNLSQLWFLTMTFHENVTDKREASRRWKPVTDWLARRGIEYSGVWQQQKRGAWHMHALINGFVDIVEFRAFAVDRGWGTFINLQVVGEYKGFRSRWTPQGVVNYICRYLTRDYCSHVPSRVRLSAGRQSTKCGTTKFSWVGGLSRVWRLGCQSMGYRPGFNDYEGQTKAWRYGCIVAGLDYVQVMHQLLGIAPAQRSTA